MSEQSDTPRTDAKEDHCRCLNDRAWGIQGWKFAEQLERELAEARELVEMQKETMRQMREKYGIGERHVMRELEQQRDRLAVSLRKLIYKLLGKQSGADITDDLVEGINLLAKLNGIEPPIEKENQPPIEPQKETE